MTVSNLYVHYDDDMMPHFFVNDREVSKDEWVQYHPQMKGEKRDGRKQVGKHVGGEQVRAATRNASTEGNDEGSQGRSAQVRSRRAGYDVGRPEGGTDRAYARRRRPRG